MTTIPLPQTSAGFQEASLEILTPDAEAFLGEPHARFEVQRHVQIEARWRRQQAFDQGEFPSFLPGTEQIRNSTWTVAPIPHELLDRHVEITGPLERKMTINALNSGARRFAPSDQKHEMNGRRSPSLRTAPRVALSCHRDRRLTHGRILTAVSQLPYTGAEIAEWLFHQEKATLENAGKCT
jgi:hypothetical protein